MVNFYQKAYNANEEKAFERTSALRKTLLEIKTEHEGACPSAPLALIGIPK